MIRMRALQVVRYGAPREALEIRDVPAPEPGPGLVRIRVSAGSLNWGDIDRCHGRLTSVRPELPFTLGMDACGEVDAAGPGAEHWLGRRVVAITLTALGGLAEAVLAPADSVFDAPESLDDAEAASFLLPFHTTRLALARRARLAAGETLLVHAGASGLGSAAIQLGVAAGARVLATAGGPEKVQYCLDLGAEVAIDHRSEDFVDRVFEITDGRGADVICDLAGGDFTERSWTCVAREGRYLIVGFTDDPENGRTARALRPAAQANFSLVGVMAAYVNHVPLPLRKFGFNPFPRAVADEVHADLLRLLAEQRIRPTLERRVTLAEAPAALEDHAARLTRGRTAVLLASP
jgi:NADPH2:quinone reductase